MNKTYALVWNQTQGCWSAVGETARRRGKSAGGKRVVAAAAVSLLGFTALPAFALPTGENIAHGKADILRDADGKSMSINQHTDKLVTNWQDFSVAGGERVSFHQPGSQSIALNRVIGNNGSQIHGQIDANGKVFLVNPNGVLFGSGAQINVGGLVASTQNISDGDFLAGNYRFSGTSTASIANDGKITAADGGSVALLGARVSNNGVIQAKMGRVALGAGNAFKVNFDGSDLLSLQVEGGAVDAQATNGGLLKADGGEVLMTARAAGNLLNAVVNNTGTIEAKGLSGRGGKITLDGGTVNVAGKLDAGGDATGTVLTRGERVNVAADTQVDTRAGNAAGTWTIEAANAGVNGQGGGDRSIGADTLSRNLDTTNVALTNTRSNLTVDGPVAWNSDRALTLTAQHGDVELKQALSAAGEKASVVVNAADKIRVNDAIKLTGRNAHLELNSTNGHTFTGDQAVVTLSGDNASYRSNGEDYKVLHTLADLRGIDADLKGRYVLGNAIDNGYTERLRSIGGDRAFSGVFDGLGNTLSRLSIYNPGSTTVGLFSQNAGRIANLNLRSTMTVVTGLPYGSPVLGGTLAGINTGVISNVTALNVAVSAKGRTIIGGLVGGNYGGTIEHATVSGFVGGDRGVMAAGGLAGENLTRLDRSPATATIRDSHADVQVSVGLDGSAGGLVGINNGTIERSSSAGSVVADGDAAMVGGLVGLNREDGIIRQSSSSASASVRTNGNAIAGGLVGINLGTIEASRASGNVLVRDISTAGGLVGLNFGTIESSVADNTVVAGQFGIVGGLVGSNHGRIGNSQANGRVTAGDKTWAAGGLVGVNTGEIDASTATGDLVVGSDSTAGGFVGRNEQNARIRASKATGSVRVGDNSTAGGFAGVNSGFIETSRALGRVQGGGASTAGGFVGLNEGTIDASGASGDVIATDSSTVGGFAGYNAGKIDTSTASGNVTARYASNAGGFAGINNGTIHAAQASGNVVAGHSSAVGGLIGRNRSQVSESRASGSAKAGDSSAVGGLIGVNERGNVTLSSASGDAEGGANANVGGLIGELTGTVDQSRATGSAKGGDASYVGGLIGSNGGIVKASSSSGTVSGGRHARLGGLAGGNFGRFEGSSTTSRIDVTDGYNQFHGQLVGVNYGQVKP
ncbi:filamentous hemagglutinin N-terminal domain-containing protein [Burkholderia cenocepacia]|uniref:GLUG motif-containing protein n=1 Tax=Burkholderia TaxID=32008 RepID=UPI0015884AE8|nr:MULTISPECIES: GLUG motif-containing protein [Burkholderia]MBR8207455.1 filamentous hemagglutinin N-terminal domain-containing protein [Burkholderia cenocepacia]